jgi:hypothetical protein
LPQIPVTANTGTSAEAAAIARVTAPAPARGTASGPEAAGRRAAGRGRRGRQPGGHGEQGCQQGTTALTAAGAAGGDVVGAHLGEPRHRTGSARKQRNGRGDGGQ